MKCSQTRAIQTHIITYPYLNFHKTLFGGQLMAWLDETAGISAVRVSRAAIVTASVDHLDFLAPLKASHSACIEAYVSGVGTRSIEIFAKIIGEDLLTGDRYLAGTCFMTFVVPKGASLPEKIEPETKEEHFICQGYEARKQVRQAKRQESLALASNVDLDIPWN
ncbi:acyl-CoA thioesterase [Enterococcus ureilyticus]|uniref:Acyl-CoA thioesterase n=1 Tax=Enterococcus ureilyticus TaxID=1131292 RepID=A0A1E5HBC7_9ENTE|nr:acyl-CoA thioesterase [Enterococcus ureilyticus]MBM7690068.1 acyl-CoA hydrolase [Enterococcus ureilyticus]MBO0446761.1 acyl-CoA thioesterase [Enterococcus ureilyticus]OEG22238.1 acyl-CoA thioesterase [Enterococcus ureilyticus]